jgi:hypothetical protein
MALELGFVSYMRAYVIISVVDNSVGIATAYGLDGRGSIPARGKRFFSIALLLAHPTSYPMGNGGSFPDGKTGEHEIYHSPPSSSEVKNGGP